MSVTINIDNYGALNIKEKLILTADIAAGVTSLPVVNSDGPVASDFLVLGALGTEYSEKVQASATTPTPDATHINLQAVTAIKHSQFDPAWLLFGDQIQVYRAPNVDGNFPADTAYTTLGSPISIDTDEMYTAYTDASGSNAYWYKFVYKNSVSGNTTNLADSVAKRGGGYGTYTSVENIRREAGLYNNQFITDAMIDAARYRAQFEIDGALQGMYTIPFQPPINPIVATMTDKLAASYLLATDYGPMASGNSKDADKKLTEYQRIMQKIDSKSYVLTDVNGNDMSIAGAGGNKAWPNDTTDSTPVDQGGSQRNFRMGMRF